MKPNEGEGEKDCAMPTLSYPKCLTLTVPFFVFPHFLALQNKNAFNSATTFSSSLSRVAERVEATSPKTRKD